MGEHRFGHVYLIFTVVFGRFRRAARAPGAKVESAAQCGELQFWLAVQYEGHLGLFTGGIFWHGLQCSSLII